MVFSVPSPFTPNLAEAEALEAVFVQRQALAERMEELVLESVNTESKHQQLVVGGPGLGKTHLLALIRQRLLQKSDLADGLKIAWLGENAWQITSFLDLLLCLIEAIEETDADADKHNKLLYDLSPSEAEREAGAWLQKIAGSRTMLVVVENLHTLFDGLGEEGQQRLRAYMQDNPFITLLASTPNLFDGISSRQAPFYGTFSIDHLEPLNEDDTALLLWKIAKRSNNLDLAGFMETPAGRNSIRAFHHLAGGNHRFCALFSRHLTRAGLMELDEPILKALDDLTPFCRAWMAALPPQPRKILFQLCQCRGGTAVKELAKRCFLKHQTVSSQLKLLRNRGYVRATPLGRDVFYEVHDPLMRLCLEVKKDRGENLHQLVGFLKHWYADSQADEILIQAVRSLLKMRSTSEVWFQQAKKLLGTLNEKGGLNSLAQGLVRTISSLKSHLFGAEGARIWLGIWKELAGKRPELQLSLRLLDAAVRTLETPGPRALLGLAAEERKIVKNLL